MRPRFERLFGGVAASLVDASRARPLLVVVLCAALTAGSLWVAATILKVDTDSDRLLSPDLPVRQTNLALEAAFPDLHRNLVVVVEADDPADARTAAEELTLRLRELPERYPDVFLPGDDPFYQMTFLAKCGQFTNFAGGCNERLDEIIAAGTFETDPAVRNALSLEAQQLMIEDADRIYLWSANWALATRSDITGVTKDFTEVPRFENLSRG